MLFVAWAVYQRAERARSHTVYHAKIELEAIRNAIEQYSRVNNRLPGWTDGDHAIALSSESAYRLLVMTNNVGAISYLSNRSPWKSQLRLVDPWGRDYHFSMDIPRKSNKAPGPAIAHYSVKIWSNGPNLQNKSGQAGDIVSGPFDVAIRAE